MDEVPHALSQIATRWSSLNDPAQFIRRYGPAVQAYFEALLRPPYDADDAYQRFCLRVVEKGFALASADRGRFRDYLKRSVRNAAFNYRRDHPPAGAALIAERHAAEDAGEIDRRWLAQWQACVLDRAWRALEQHEQQHTGSFAFTVLRLATDHPDENSVQLADRLGAQTGKPIRADAFRKQLSRARRLFGELLCAEVAQTLADPTPEAVVAELRETGLLPYLRDLLPDEKGESS